MSAQPDNPSEKDVPLDGAIGEISHGPSAFEQFLDNNQKKLIIGGVVLIIGLIAYVVIDGLQLRAEKNAAAAVSQAADITELRAAAEEHKGSNAEGAALFRIAQQQWVDQRQDEAIATLEDFIVNHQGHRLFLNAKAALASYHLELGEVAKAKAGYEEVAAYPSHELYGLSLVNLGDIALQEGDHEAAKGYYERIGTEFEGKIAVGIKNHASNRLELVGVSPPAVEKVEPPKVDPPAQDGKTSARSTTNPVEVPQVPELPEGLKVETTTPKIKEVIESAQETAAAEVEDKMKKGVELVEEVAEGAKEQLKTEIQNLKESVEELPEKSAEE